MAVLASKTSSHPRGKEEEIGALVSLGLGKNKNAVSCQNPAAEPVLLISVRAAITTLPSLGGLHRLSSPGGVVVRVTSSFSLRPGSLAGTCALRSCR